MRLRYFTLLASLLAACNSVLGNVDRHLVEAAGGADAVATSCQFNSNCAQGDVCIFQTCRRPCTGEADCASGSRCLQTDGGTACVSVAAATCDAGCPAGTTCSDAEAVCRNACDTAPCLAGQTCSAGLCVGTDLDGCLGKVCDTPPAAACESPESFKTYDKMGSCVEGECSYTDRAIACTCQNRACTTDPCITVACDSPPAASCKNASTLTSYAVSGSCSEGSCSYEPTDTGCSVNQHCRAGLCAVCQDDANCEASCSACSGSAKKCKPLGATSKCVACVSNADCSGTTLICNTTTNVCQSQPSCVGLAKTCGPSGTADCCAAGLIAGGTFNLGNSTTFPATVSSFRLDNFEITVGRFRTFVAAYSQAMTTPGAGKNPNNPSDPGWDTAWNAILPANAAALTSALKCDVNYHTWADKAGTALAESLPLNCLNWFEAEAFCIWDGGRLPTEAEWNYAAAGGTAQRLYPWGSADPDCSYANFQNGDYCVSPGTGAVNRVGSESTKGDGLYGQSDLAGNVWEWVQDWYADSYSKPCIDCANLAASTGRVLRGGGFNQTASSLPSSNRLYDDYSASKVEYGARCARTP